VAGPAPVLEIPTTLHASLLTRLDRLGPAREIAQIGAALGRQFSHELISAAAKMPQRHVDEGLARLAGTELIYRRGTPPDADYIFKHALVQEAAYGTLLRSRRRQIHGRITTVIEERFPRIVLAQPALFARHCAEGGLAEKSVGYWLKAGQQELARSAIAEAVTLLRNGLDAVSHLPEGLRRQELELDLQLALGPALAATKGHSAGDVGVSFARANALAEQMHRPEYAVPVIISKWSVHLGRSEHMLALSLAEQVEEIGQRMNHLGTQLQGRRMQGLTRSLLGQFVAACAILERCHDLRSTANRGVRGGMSGDPYALMLAHLAVTLAHLGHIDQARARRDEALFEARRLRHAVTLASVLNHVNWMESVTLSPELGSPATELLSLSDEHGFPFHSVRGIAYRGQSLITAGRAQEGAALALEALEASRATRTVVGTPRSLISLAEAYTMLGKLSEGLKCIDHASQIIEATNERHAEAELHRPRGKARSFSSCAPQFALPACGVSRAKARMRRR
jgi:hypothetical protein